MRPLLLAVALGLVACSSGRAGSKEHGNEGSAGEAGRDPQTLIVANYNVLYSLAEKKSGVEPAKWADPATLAYAEKLDADVLILQETNEAWEGALKAVLGKRYPNCVFHRPRRWLPEGLGVCSRHPVELISLIESSDGIFPAQHVRVNAPGGRVEILNVHLQPAISGAEGWWEEHRATRPKRKREIDACLARLPASGPLIVAGDFNEAPEGDLFKSLEAAGFENALPRAGEKAITWRWLDPKVSLAAQLDHVAYRAAAFELVSATVPRGGNSDHYAVVVKLRWKATVPAGAK